MHDHGMMSGNGVAALVGSEATENTNGMRIQALFCPDDQRDVFETVEWERRTAQIKGENGELLFEQQDCEIPKSWSQLATNVVVSKYFYGEIGTAERETSVRQLIRRVVNTIADWGHRDGYFATDEDADRFRRELSWLCLHQHGAFNSPVWFNVGLHPEYGVTGAKSNWAWDRENRRTYQPDPYEHPQGSACFIQSVTDSMESIMELATSEAMLFKFGSGTGTDLSTLRSKREKLSGGGKPSGPLSFMKIYDQIAATVKSGGKCLAGHQPVYTAGGVKTVKELADRDARFTVLSYSKRLGRVAAKPAQAWVSGMKPVVAVKTDKGEFHVSYDHPFLLSTGEVVRAEQLKSGQSLLAGSTQKHPHGYVQLETGCKRYLLHRMVAQDVCGWDIRGKVVHHESGDKLNSESTNLSLLPSQADHASLHGRQQAADGSHVFQTNKFPKTGDKNGMHRDAAFWQDGEKVAAYQQTQGKILKDSGRAAEMQQDAARKKMLNVGYELINAGYNIETFELYVEARKLHGRRCPSVPGQLQKFERVFGDYAGFVQALRDGNHRVVSVEHVGAMPVYSVEVIDDEPDDGRDWTEHNYAICPIGSTQPYVGFVFTKNTRRAAKMQSMKDWHPDILEFIECKQKEEAKARSLIAAGYEANFNGEAYSSVMFQNANLSVRLSDEFMNAVLKDQPWVTKWVTDRTKDGPTYQARDLMTRMSECAWQCGDPGVQYDTTINAWHTSPSSGRINASNPCSEYMYIDDTACNLASLNLKKFQQPDGSFDAERFHAACRLFFIAQEILVDNASYPTAKIAANSHKFRPLGLGYANLGSLLMASGLPYDSDEARAVASAVTAVLHGAANLTSVELAKAMGPFAGYAENAEPMLGVMHRHRECAYKISPKCPQELRAYTRQLWDLVTEHGREHGFRNAQATVLAPTGTIAFLMDCDTTGIEPDIALVKYKQLAGGGMLKIVNNTVPEALLNLGYDRTQIADIETYISKQDTIEGAPHLLERDLPVFDCAFQPRNGKRSIAWRAHVTMMAAAQPFISGAISKTVNMPKETTPAEIAEAYILGWRLGLKALAIYRDGSKESQPLSTSTESDKEQDKQAALVAKPKRQRLPDTRQSLTHKFSITGHEGYFTVGLFEDGRPGELFVTMAKEGSTISGLMDCFATAISMSLQYGVPLEVYVNKFSHTRFEPMGFTKHTEIRTAKSIVDYIFRWLGLQFIPGYREANRGHEEPQPSVPPAKPAPVVAAKPSTNGHHAGNGHQAGNGQVATMTQAEQFASFQQDAPSCENCGAIMVRNGKCYLCHSCGHTSGCS